MPYDDELASIYDAIYESKKDYSREAERAHRIIEQHKCSEGKELLDVACGTGAHAQYLKRWYVVEGVDSSESQLAVARRRLPDLLFHRADMTELELGRPYDAVTCLFNSIAHVLTLEKLTQAIGAMARHVKRGGVLLVEPWIEPDAFVEGMLDVDVVTVGDAKIVRVTRAMRDGPVVRFSLTHFVSRGGLYETPFTVQQESALYRLDDYLGAFRAAGLSVSYDERGLTGRRGVIIGRQTA